MAAFAASLTLSDARLVVIPTVPVANTLTTDTFDIKLGRAGTITGLVFDNMNTINGSFKVSKVSALGAVTDIITVAAGAAAGNEIVSAAAYAAFDTDYATTLAKRSFIATDTLRVTCLTANSAGVINIDVALSKTPSVLQ
jgi:hypothetical protein